MFFLRKLAQYPSSLIFIHPPALSYIDSKQRKQINSREFEKKVKKWSSQWTQFTQLRKEAWKKKKKIQGLNGVWTRDLVITGAVLYQLSYEATVKEMSVNDIWTAEKKWKWRNDRRSDRSLWRSFLHFYSFQQFIDDLFHISLTQYRI